MSRQKPLGVPQDVAAIRERISSFFRQKTEAGLTIGSYFGVYVFFDYDGEPIYVGQSHESLGQRVGRHMTNQRTDAVAMNVLDPFEVAWIEVFLLHHRQLNPPTKQEILIQLDALEYTVFQKVLSESALGAVLNEKDLLVTGSIELPPSYKGGIIPEHLFEQRKHPDIRIARRANTIARLAQVISEREVSPGLRRTLLTQARRLERLAAERFEPFSGKIPVAESGEETREVVDD
jgi:hypothetical protein